jgi:hypothetical protein
MSSSRCAPGRTSWRAGGLPQRKCNEWAGCPGRQTAPVASVRHWHAHQRLDHRHRGRFFGDRRKSRHANDCPIPSLLLPNSLAPGGWPGLSSSNTPADPDQTLRRRTSGGVFSPFADPGRFTTSSTARLLLYPLRKTRVVVKAVPGPKTMTPLGIEYYRPMRP